MADVCDRSTNVTDLLPAMRSGDREACGQVMRALYQDLRRQARARLGAEYGERTLSATELVNESFLRLFTGARLPPLNDRKHLLALAARTMREVLVDAGRRRRAIKRCSANRQIDLARVVESLAGDSPPEALAAALGALEEIDPRQARIVFLRFFAGLTERDVGAVLGLSERTVQREWRIARAWLRRELA